MKAERKYMIGEFPFKYLVYARNGLSVTHFTVRQGRPPKRRAQWFSLKPSSAKSICPLRMRCASSPPAMTTAPLLNRLKPSMTFALESTLQSCWPITLFKYFEDGTFVSPGSKPRPSSHARSWSFFRQIENFLYVSLNRRGRYRRFQEGCLIKAISLTKSRVAFSPGR
jgi:hypothetical protein